jgi:hypothetical protein
MATVTPIAPAMLFAYDSHQFNRKGRRGPVGDPMGYDRSVRNNLRRYR